MNKIFEIADAYLAQSCWKDISLLKFCLIALGMLIGMEIPENAKKKVQLGAGLVFLATYVPVMSKFFRVAAEELRK